MIIILLLLSSTMSSMSIRTEHEHLLLTNDAIEMKLGGRRLDNLTFFFIRLMLIALL